MYLNDRDSSYPCFFLYQTEVEESNHVEDISVYHLTFPGISPTKAGDTAHLPDVLTYSIL